jgi:hypothetical protein
MFAGKPSLRRYPENRPKFAIRIIVTARPHPLRPSGERVTM